MGKEEIYFYFFTGIIFLLIETLKFFKKKNFIRIFKIKKMFKEKKNFSLAELKKMDKEIVREMIYLKIKENIQVRIKKYSYQNEADFVLNQNGFSSFVLVLFDSPDSTRIERFIKLCNNHRYGGYVLSLENFNTECKKNLLNNTQIKAVCGSGLLKIINTKSHGI